MVYTIEGAARMKKKKKKRKEQLKYRKFSSVLTLGKS